MDGFLLIDKPAGITSHDVVDAVRKVTKTRRVGHAGTLDPFATGLLVIGIGKATKELGGLTGQDKTYEAVARLGAVSTTDDIEGDITERPAPAPSYDDINRAFDVYRGGYVQKAPIYSAKKVKGKKLYELARKGKIEGVEIPSKQVTIHALQITKYDWPFLAFHTRCGSGTYIRALARDIGETLGTGAYLTELRRTTIGDLNVKDALSLKDLNVQTFNKHLSVL